MKPIWDRSGCLQGTRSHASPTACSTDRKQRKVAESKRLKGGIGHFEDPPKWVRERKLPEVDSRCESNRAEEEEKR